MHQLNWLCRNHSKTKQMKNKRKLIVVLIFLFLQLFISYDAQAFDIKGKQLRVPSEYVTIAEAVENAKDGDMIIIAPGEYKEKEIMLTKAITITSEWKLSGDKSIIDKTIIDSGMKKLFLIRKDGIEISGLKVINGDHPLDVKAKVTIIHNHLAGNRDAISMEAGSGGYVAYNIMENDIDDGLDIDIGDDSQETIGSDVLIEYNTIINSHDDGIEIRLFSRVNQNVIYTIRRNTIIGSGNAGIQLISYDLPTGKVFYISDNIFENCKTALGCMKGAKTGENLEGAAMMDEPVYFFNNTIVNNTMGATGGNTMYAFNNLVVDNAEGGFKRFGKNSIVQNNIFYNNGSSNFIELAGESIVKDNLLDVDPQISLSDFSLSEDSPAINAGLKAFIIDGKLAVTILEENISGEMPDLGAVEKGWKGETAEIIIPVLTEAGYDIVSKSNKIQLVGNLLGDAKNSEILWVQETGPEKIEFLDENKLKTTALFKQHGIYRLALTAKDGILNAKDQVIVRYINDGTGKVFIAKQNKNFNIDAEDCTYSYGHLVEVVDTLMEGNLLFKMKSKPEKETMLEFFVRMNNLDFFNLWIRCKSSVNNSLSINFNDKKIANASISPSEELTWIKVDEKIRATGGRWSLYIQLNSGEIEIDKIVLTPDENFHPQ